MFLAAQQAVVRVIQCLKSNVPALYRSVAALLKTCVALTTLAYNVSYKHNIAI
jgi:hypothetical protein